MSDLEPQDTGVFGFVEDPLTGDCDADPVDILTDSEEGDFSPITPTPLDVGGEVAVVSQEEEEVPLSAAPVLVVEEKESTPAVSPLPETEIVSESDEADESENEEDLLPDYVEWTSIPTWGSISGGKAVDPADILNEDSIRAEAESLPLFPFDTVDVRPCMLNELPGTKAYDNVSLSLSGSPLTASAAFKRRATDTEDVHPEGVPPIFPYTQALNDKISIWRGDPLSLTCDAMCVALLHRSRRSRVPDPLSQRVMQVLTDSMPDIELDLRERAQNVSVGGVVESGGARLPCSMVLHALMPHYLP
ncbi:hypothetical protein KIPB_011405, partial [Kipferlia bialata]|eukprot:g11405.t1